LGLLHIDLLREIIVKKFILHDHLMDLPYLGYHNEKCQMYGIHIHYWSEGLIIVNAMHPLKSFGKNLGFVSANLSIRCALGPVDSSAPNKFPSIRKEN
jgi:hypothetical protein